MHVAANLTTAALGGLTLFCTGAVSDCTPELVSVRKIWDQAPHSAFTDLARFQKRWYCVFREADRHGGGTDGKLRVLVSADGETWASAALLAEEGVDLRDPKLSVMPDGRLMLVAGGSIYENGRYRTRRPRVAFSKDGRTWTATRAILGDGDWLWRVTWHKGRAYSVSKLGVGDNPRQGFLYTSTDGLNWKKISELKVPGVSETTLRFLVKDEMIALVRCEAGKKNGWIGTSKPPYTEWAWFETKWRLGGPNFIELPDGSLWAGSRKYNTSGSAETMLAKMDRRHFEPALVLPSGGDTSYPGMVWHGDHLWMSYYASHEGKSSIYLARIRFEP